MFAAGYCDPVAVPPSLEVKMEDSPVGSSKKSASPCDSSKKKKSASPCDGNKSVSPRDRAVKASPSWEKKSASQRDMASRRLPSWEKKAAAEAARRPCLHVTR